jgi:hypothetical protein
MEFARLLQRAREVLRDEGPEALELRARRRLWGDQRRVFQDYAEWRRAYPAGKRALAPPSGPPISVVVPVHDPPPRALFELLRSIREQHYRTWDLTLVDDGSRSSDVRRLLDEAARESRVRLVRHPHAQGIGAATAAGVAHSAQELIAFVDHDDLLAAEALCRVAQVFAGDPKLDLLYTDEDKLDPAGRHTAPFFKPAWDPILLLGWNYVGHLAVVRRSALEKAGGLRPDMDGAQDYDLLLRLSEHARKVAHVPQVLYHWRAVPGSTAASPAAKPSAHVAAQRALQEALARRELAGTVTPGAYQGTLQLDLEPRIAPDQVTACVLGERVPEWLGAAGVQDVLTVGRHPGAGALDLLARHVHGRALLLVDEGVTPRREPAQALRALLGWLQPGLAGLVVPQLLRGGRVVDQGLVLDRTEGGLPGPFEALAAREPGYFGLASVPRSVATASGQLLLVDADAWRQAGGLGASADLTEGAAEPGWLFAGVTDLCARARAAGRRAVALPEPFDLTGDRRPLRPCAGPDPWHNPNFLRGDHLRLVPEPAPHPARVLRARALS